MALNVKVGQITGPAAIEVGTDHSYTGVGFQPKAIIFYGNRRDADGSSHSNTQDKDMLASLGFAVSSASMCAEYRNDFGGGDHFADFDILSSAVYHDPGAADTDWFDTGTTGGGSLDADGFTLHYYANNNAGGLGWKLNYLALGGADLTNANVKHYTHDTTTGNVSYSGVGFKPDAIIISFAYAAATGSWGMGMAASTTQRGSYSASYDGTSIARYQRSDKVIACCNGGTKIHEADLVSFDSDGFTLNWGTGSSHQLDMVVLCLKGGRYFVGSQQVPAANGSQSTSGVGFAPKAIFCGTDNQDPSTTIDTSNDYVHIGAATALAQICIDVGEDSGNGAALLDSTRVLNSMSPTEVALADAQLTSMDSDGFTLNWANIGASANNQFLFMAFGDAPASGGPRGVKQVRPLMASLAHMN